MIAKEQHGNCGKETENKDYETAQKSDSEAMNGFDPGGKGNSNANMSQTTKQNIPTEINGQTHGQHLDKIHSELTIASNNSDDRGEKSKQIENDSIELSNITKSDVNNHSTINTQSTSHSNPKSSVIQIEPSPQQKLSENQSLDVIEENGNTPAAHNPTKSCSTEDAVSKTLRPKAALRNRFGDRRSFGQLPLLFERATPSYFTPRFDSRVLEEQYWKSSFPRTTRRFQLGLIYLLFLTIALSIYFPAGQRPTWPVFLGLTLGTVSIVAGMLGTCRKNN